MESTSLFADLLDLEKYPLKPNVSSDLFRTAKLQLITLLSRYSVLNGT